MADESTGTLTTDEAPSIDIAAASEQIGADLFSDLHNEDSSPQETVAKAVVDSGAAQDQAKQAAAPTGRQAPKSWAKDMHPHWEKTDPEVQGYIEKREKDFLDGLDIYKTDADFAKTFRREIAPFQQTINGLGLTPEQAAKQLFQADHNLRYAPEPQKLELAKKLLSNYGIDISKLTPTPASGTETATPVDPRLTTIEQQLEEMRGIQTRQQQAALQAAQEKAGKEVAEFASDPKHAFFDECYEDIVKLLKVGESLQDAYDKAVWANPVTREKSKLAYFQTESEKAKERARLDALPKQKARGVNVRSQDTQRGPTDPLGSMEDTMRATLKTIKERTIH